MNKLNGNSKWAVNMFCLLVLLFLYGTAQAAPPSGPVDIPIHNIPLPRPTISPFPGVNLGGSEGETAAQINAEIEANFAGNMVQIASENAYFPWQLANLPDGYLARMSHFLYVSTEGDVTPFLKVATQSGVNLNDGTYAVMQLKNPAYYGESVDYAALACRNAVRLANSFGRQYEDPVVVAGFLREDAVDCYWQTVGSYQSGSTLASGAIKRSQAHYQELGLNTPTLDGSVVASHVMIAIGPRMMVGAGYTPAPLPTMPLTDAFLEFYAGGEGTSVVEALIELADWASGPLGRAAVVGTAIGTFAYNVGEKVSPGVYEDMIENLVNTFGPVELGDTLPTGTITIGDPVMLDWGDDFDDDDYYFYIGEY